jgi:hypothetical protein
MRGEAMTNKQEKFLKKFYYSMIEFEQDFFPKTFREKQEEKPTDNQSIGISLAKESFRKIKQEVTQGKISAVD